VDVVGRRDGGQAHAGATAADLAHHGLHHLEQQACAVFDGAAVGVGALVGAALEELVQQVAVGAVHLDAVEAGGPAGRPCGAAIVVNDAWEFGELERARCGDGHEAACAVLDDEGLGVGGDGRGRDRRGAPGLQAHVRDATHMPQLHHDVSALRMHGIGDAAPASGLGVGVEARHVGIALALRADRCGFGNEQACAGALGVVAGHQCVGHIAGRAVAGQRRHDDAVFQLQVTGLCGVKEGGHEVIVAGLAIWPTMAAR
jgi:hypothetical protein